MALKIIRNIIFFTAFVLANQNALCQNIDVDKNEFSELKNEDLKQNQDQSNHNEFIVEDASIENKFSFKKRTRGVNNNKTIVSEDCKTKIGSLISRIGIGIRKYCQDNNISGKRLFKISKLFI